MAEVTTRFPAYVTDGFHIYVWHEEYERLLKEGKLQPSDPPPPPKVKKISPREKTKLEAIRKQALAEAERAVDLLKHTTTPDLEDVFGSPPKDE